MSAFSGLAYAQIRVQSRYGARAEAGVWLKLHNIHDLGSYLQAAQQTPLHPWVLGLSSTHTSDDIELALRQKYRHHVDEVAGWMPVDWRKPVQWIKRLTDLPIIQYLITGGEPHDWMKSDPDISPFTADDPLARLQMLQQTDNRVLVESWEQQGSVLAGWVSQWDRMRPKKSYSENGLSALEKLLRWQMQQQLRFEHARPADHEEILDRLRLIFRRHAFQPAAVCAYLAIVAIDLHRIRSDLMRRIYFQHEPDLALGLPE
jgi:hypothetical protein